MVTKELLKSEIDKVRDENLDVLYKIILSLEGSVDPEDSEDWSTFVAATYGSFADDPIERSEQGRYETRIPFE
ncbi:MAG TPA: hypothetical protein VH988_02210 [Thermoanaerobaculia bacterium]|jgi:hypothetical protein|nr:hypothetical protein [Thermoanaerobaculia bacterium]